MALTTKQIFFKICAHCKKSSIRVECSSEVDVEVTDTVAGIKLTFLDPRIACVSSPTDASSLPSLSSVTTPRLQQLSRALNVHWFKVQSLTARPSHWKSSAVSGALGLGGGIRGTGCRTVMTTTTGIEVRHDPAEQAFYMQIQQGEIALVQYEWVGEGVLNLYHTEVPPAYQGQGLGKHLAKAALDFAVEKDVKVIPSCSYIAKYIADHPLPQYTSRVQAS